MNRRLFLQQMAKLAMASALPTQYFFEKIMAANASSKRRRHFINLIGKGGWDSSWHINTFSGAHLIRGLDSHFSLSPGGFEFTHGEKSYKYTTKCSSEEERELGRHPGGARLGPAMNLAMGSSNWDRTLIWKGIDHPGQHEINNRMLIHGNISSYAISTSGLIAAVLAQSDRRPLHYVLMASAPTDLLTNFAMAEDAAIPVCLNGLNDFAALTSMDPAEPTNPGVQADIYSTVQKLSLEVLAKRTKLASSQTVARAYAASLEGAKFVYGSNLAADPEMLYLKKYYFLQIVNSFKQLAETENVSTRAAAVRPFSSPTWKYSDIYAGLASCAGRYAALPTYADFVSNPSSHRPTLIDIEVNPTGVSAPPLASNQVPLPVVTILNRLRLQAGHYAFADFLIRKNLSAVVDLPAWPNYMDAHGESQPSYLDELILTQATFTCFFALQRSLQGVTLPEGGTLLDATMIALHTDFDRLPFHETKDPLSDSQGKMIAIGTNHGSTASLLLAGYGVQGGKVMGGVHEGTSSMIAAFPRFNYLAPLPIDLKTGLVSNSGKVTDILSVAPTLLSAFGTALPAQQVTEALAVPAAVTVES